MRRPNLDDLQRGLDQFRSSSTGATADDPAERYEQRIAQHLEDVVQRERELGAALRAGAQQRLGVLLGRAGPLDALEAELCRRLRAGEIDESSAALMRHLRAQASAQLGIDNPRYWSLEAAKGRAGI